VNRIGPETIVAAAIFGSNGVVYTLPPPNRHNHIIVMMGSQVFRQTCPQGFLTNTGRFVSRKEALAIATVAGQLIRKTSPTDRLFTNDLW
jgi:hypothetical protein